jgi:aerobic-type carbon monoxide dehydrogenase small subunit (CoxS/CutS family)
MTKKEKLKKPVELSRREFLRDAGLLVGGTAIGSTILLAACGSTETETVTNTVTRTNTATVTSTAGAVTETVTSTTTVGAGQTATVTQTETATESKFVCPVDGMEFDTLAELQAHFAAEHGDIGAIPGLVTLNVNGRSHQLVCEPYWTLAFVLRDRLSLFGLKNSCGRGACGSCTVIMDGKAVYACMILAVSANGKSITTIESLSDGITLHPIQQAFYDLDATQCGFCIPGYIMAAKALLDENPNPSFDEVKEGLSGHWCNCGMTKKIVQAVLSV